MPHDAHAFQADVIVTALECRGLKDCENQSNRQVPFPSLLSPTHSHCALFEISILNFVRVVGHSARCVSQSLIDVIISTGFKPKNTVQDSTINKV